MTTLTSIDLNTQYPYYHRYRQFPLPNPPVQKRSLLSLFVINLVRQSILPGLLRQVTPEKTGSESIASLTSMTETSQRHPAEGNGCPCVQQNTTTEEVLESSPSMKTN